MNDFQHELLFPAPPSNAGCRTGPAQDQDRTFTLHDPRGRASASISLPPLHRKMKKKEEQAAIKGWMSGFSATQSLMSHLCLWARERRVWCATKNTMTSLGNEACGGADDSPECVQNYDKHSRSGAGNVSKSNWSIHPCLPKEMQII